MKLKLNFAAVKAIKIYAAVPGYGLPWLVVVLAKGRIMYPDCSAYPAGKNAFCPSRRMGGVRIFNRASFIRGLVLPQKSRTRLPLPA